MTEELIERLRACPERSRNTIEAANALQSQAERIKFLEADRNLEKKMRKDADECADNLRAQLAEITATEPVWFHKIGVHGEHRFYNQTETQPEGCTPLFTRPMPPQIIGLQDVHDAITADPTLADCAQDVTELVEALEEATTYTSSPSWSPAMTRDCESAIKDLRTALAQQGEQPVGSFIFSGSEWNQVAKEYEQDHDVTPLYAAPQPTSGNYALGYAEGFNDACKPAPQPAQSDVPEVGFGNIPTKFLANGTRFKLNFDTRGRVSSLWNFMDELNGRWVALVAAEDDCHLQSAQPVAPAPQAQEPHVWMIQGSHGTWKGEHAEMDAKAEAKRCGGTCYAYPLYTHPAPKGQA